MTLEEEYVFKKLAGQLEDFFYAPVGSWDLPELEGVTDGAWVRITEKLKGVYSTVNDADIRQETFKEWKERNGQS